MWIYFHLIPKKNLRFMIFLRGVLHFETMKNGVSIRQISEVYIDKCSPTCIQFKFLHKYNTWTVA